MRKFVAAVVVAGVVAAGIPLSPTFAQEQLASAPVPGPKVVADAVAGFPSGGDPLKNRIADLIYERPELAADVANYLRTDAAGLSPAQKEALEAGLAEGLNRLGVVGQVVPLVFAPSMLGVGTGAAIAAGGAAVAIAGKKSSTTAVSPN